MTSQAPHATSLEPRVNERDRSVYGRRLPHLPCHDGSVRKDGGFRRTCAADPWIGDDDDFLVGAHRRGTGTEPVTRL